MPYRQPMTENFTKDTQMETNDSIQRNTRWVQTFDRILEMLNLDAEHPVSLLKIEGNREVIIVQPNPFTI